MSALRIGPVDPDPEVLQLEHQFRVATARLVELEKLMDQARAERRAAVKGLRRVTQWSYRAIGERLGLTRQRIEQISRWTRRSRLAGKAVAA